MLRESNCSEWLTLAEWDWVQIGIWATLHAVAEVTNDADEEWLGNGRTECGRESSEMHIPGVFSRMGAARCEACCVATGMPLGKGSPKNDEECRPVAERRIAVLATMQTKEPHAQ